MGETPVAPERLAMRERGETTPTDRVPWVRRRAFCATGGLSPERPTTIVTPAPSRQFAGRQASASDCVDSPSLSLPDRHNVSLAVSLRTWREEDEHGHNRA